MRMLDKMRAKRAFPAIPGAQPAETTPAAGPEPTKPPASGKLSAGNPPAAGAESKKQRRKRKNAARMEAKAGRLPDGAKFTVIYSAENQTWSGSLEIPDAGILAEVAATGEAASSVFRGTASGVLRLLGNLDAEYRKLKASKASDGAIEEFASLPAVEQVERSEGR